MKTDSFDFYANILLTESKNEDRQEIIFRELPMGNGNFGQQPFYQTMPCAPVKPVKTSGSGQAETLFYVKYVPAGYVASHSVVVGYLMWVVGFTGAHRFYYGRPWTGLLWFCTAGLLGIGWLIDLFLIPSMNREASRQYRPGSVDYGVAWLLLAFLGWFGLHRFYQGKIVTGILYLLTGGLFGIGVVYDVFTLNQQIDEVNNEHIVAWQNVWAY